MNALALAIFFLAPHLGHTTVREYARIIHAESGRRRLDPWEFVAYVHVESRWNTRMVSKTNDWGLGAVHVAVRGSARFLGREHELWNPRVNLRETARLYAMWTRYHERECGRRRGRPHPALAHMKYGYRVKGTEHAERVLKLARWLRKRFARGET